MAKPIKTSDNGPVVEVPKGDRELRWKTYVDHYKKENPVKAAAKDARGEFDKIPDSFK